MSEEFEAGQLVGPYVLIKWLGKGAFGAVWLAEQRSSFASPQVAIKLPGKRNVDLVAFEKEARIWTAIGSHPNVLQLIMADVSQGQPFLASQHIPDGSLRNWLKSQKKIVLGAEEAIAITQGVLRGLKHLHSYGVVHRDLKPDNILMHDRQPLIADFGLARIWDTEASTQAPAGTFSYMAPEAWGGDRCPQADLWSVGVILYELLHGRLPFTGDYATLLYNITRGPLPEIDSGLPLSIQLAISKALSRSVADRFQTAESMLSAIQDGPRLPEPPDDPKRPTDNTNRIKRGLRGQIILYDAFF